MTKWTSEQEEAINKCGSNIIVSAGAGSGKTAVLSERVLEKVKNGIHVNNLLILTFTNNAAAEMKGRIKKKLFEAGFLDEAALTDSADITTFDAFTLSLVKKYHQMLNIDKNVSIISASIIKSKKKEYINEIFDEYSTNQTFIKMALDFGDKNTKFLKKTILDLDDKFDLITNKEEYLNNYIDSYYNNIDNMFTEYTDMLLNKVKIIEDLLEKLSFEVTGEFYEKYSLALHNLINSKTYEDIKLYIDIPQFKLLKSTNEGKYYKSKITEIIKELKDYTFYSKDEHINMINSTKTYAKLIIDIILKLTEKINKFKFKYNVFEFNDISKMAINLVKDNDNIRNNLKEHYKEIMIDEYQDTSDTQEEFINLIQNNNVYMVGDVKQSIYRFRHANPDIFKNKYDAYKDNIGGYKIDLKKNFRSREEVLSFINEVFNHIMDDEIGNAKYKEEHQMVFGNTSYLDNMYEDYNAEILRYTNEDKVYTNEEIEAFLIGLDIKNKIKSKYKLISGPATYQDFCILMDRTSSFDTYKKIFDYLGIPLNVYQDKDILFSDETFLINNIIKLSLNIKDKIYDENTRYYFTSIARSYLFELDDKIIYDTIKSKKYYDTDIFKLCYTLSNKIDYLSNKDIILYVINNFNFYDKLIKRKDIYDRCIIIDNIINMAEELSKVDMNVNDMTLYLDSLVKDKESIKVSGLIKDIDAVTITNIHKSKGLEYKVCYFPGLYKPFNKDDMKHIIRYDSAYGLIIPSINHGFVETIPSILSKHKYNVDDISERLRLFYVALTRCKEKIIIVSSLKEKDVYNFDNDIVSTYDRLNIKSFKDILDLTYPFISKYIKDIDIPKIDDEYKYSKELNLHTNNQDKLEVKRKEYISNIINKGHYSKESLSIITKEESLNMEYGTHMHKLLEDISFINPDYTLLNDIEKEVIEGLLSNLSNLDTATIYKEYEFKYNDKTGIIDLMLEYSDHIDIIDYKLKNVKDDAYLKQVSGYKEYIQTKTDKKINMYLYSLLDKELTNL